jgi:curved DNA-binding protein CbpA
MAENTTASAIPPEAIPIVCEATDLLSKKVTPEEGFMLSRISGLLSVEVLCLQSGLGRQKTIDLISSLRKKGLISFHDRECAAPEQGAEGAAGAVVASAFDLAELKKIMRNNLPKGDELLSLVEAIFENLEHLSYYDLLGIGKKAGEQEVKKAYLRATKTFHPDRFYRRADHEFRRKLQEIFKQANKGYRTLSDQEAKKAYDASLGIEEEVEEEVIEAAPMSARTRAVKGESSPFKRAARQKPVEEKVRKAKKPEPPPAPSGPKLKLGLKDGFRPVNPLLQKIEKIKKENMGAQIEQAEKFYRGAMVEKSRGNINAVKINLNLALQYAPGHKKYQQALEEVAKQEETIKGELEFKRGMEAQADRDLRAAAMHYKEALRCGYESGKLYHRLAELVMELDGNYERARALVLKALDLEPRIPDYHMTLARAYKGLDQKAAAIVQLEKVLQLDAKNKIAAKELKALKRG